MNDRKQQPGALRTPDIARRFDAAAAHFDKSDFVHRHAAAGLFERMSPMLVNARYIVDLGAATGNASRILARQFRKSSVLSTDLSMSMLRQAKKGRSRFSRITELRADAMHLPLRDSSVDLIFANLLMPWIDGLPGFLTEAARILRKDGLFLFSTLGPDSLAELREAWGGVDGDEHVIPFMDMHDIGDAVMRAGLREPVLDVDYLNVSWRSSKAFFDDLTHAGARNALVHRRKTLTGKKRFQNMTEGLQQLSQPAGPDQPEGTPLQLRMELIYGHAWGSEHSPASGEVRVGIDKIGRRPR